MNKYLVLALAGLLVVALGGTAAASGYIITKPSQIKPSVRKALKGKRGPIGRGAAGDARTEERRRRRWGAGTEGRQRGRWGAGTEGRPRS